MSDKSGQAAELDVAQATVARVSILDWGDDLGFGSSHRTRGLLCSVGLSLHLQERGHSQRRRSGRRQRLR